MVIALVIVRAPKPPGSKASISPPAAVFEIAPAKVLHGAVRLHGLASSPTPETQVRVAWALAGAAQSRGISAAPRIVSENASFFNRMSHLSLLSIHPNDMAGLRDFAFPTTLALDLTIP